MKKLEEVQQGQGGSYILPFLWMHGEPQDVLREEIEKIQACGIREFCVESRPYPGFCTEPWWRDMDFLIEEARSRSMRIWLLDDDRFPTGHAAGAFEKQPEKAKVYLAERHMDVIGPAEGCGVLIENFLGTEGKLLAVLACPKPDTQSLEVSPEGILNLTDQVREGVVYLDVPKGYYRIFVLFTTQKGGGRADYMNLIDRDSVRVLLDAVYEPHYERYGNEFGTTFAGFFSDEPELGNVAGYGFGEMLGQKDVRLPWSRELAERLSGLWQENFHENLVALWYGMGEKTGSIRSQYMDQVTLLVEDCFAGQIGAWCQERGVEYIGHVIEDDNAHARLGCGTGHYFREQKGQHMAGIDVVHLQILPGFKELYHQWIASDRDGEFFHFGLAKLGSSLAHIDAGKRGRALCEIFGSFGWGEGIWLMKWLTDHMLVRGINHFVPHAFSPCFPDRDCPPHFYARGNNPQYPYFQKLMHYMNRMCHLLSGGTMAQSAAVLYHGEAEWGGGQVQLFQKPVRALLEHQLDCDVIPIDALYEEQTTVRDGVLRIQEMEYPCLVIPYCEFIPDLAADFALAAAKEGLKVFVVEGHPKRMVSGQVLPDEWQSQIIAASLSELPEWVAGIAQPEIVAEKHCPDLRSCAYRQADGWIYFFFNEHPYEAVETQVRLKHALGGSLVRFDSIDNIQYRGAFDGELLHLHLDPGESAIYMTGGTNEEQREILSLSFTGSRTVISEWNVSLREAGAGNCFEEKLRIPINGKLINMNGPEGFPRFSGTFRYQGSLEIGDGELQKGRRFCLQLPGIHDGAELMVNGHLSGMMLGSPYRMEITSLLKTGINELCIDAVNTLTWKIHDGQTTHMQLFPTGMGKPPVLEWYQG